MKSFKEMKKDVEEQDYPEVRKHLRKVGKGSQVSYSHQGGTKTGKYGGLMNRGGRSYAKVHHDDGMSMVPLPQVKHK